MIAQRLAKAHRIALSRSGNRPARCFDDFFVLLDNIGKVLPTPALAISRGT
jgi:hypothetical protein